MPGVLRALPGEEEGDARPLAGRGSALRGRGRQLAAGEGAQVARQLGAVVGDQAPGAVAGAARPVPAVAPRRPATGAGSRREAVGHRAAASARSAGVVLRRERHQRPAPRARRHRGRRSSGASSRTTWALVPLKPKELTPARRGRSPRGQGVERGRHRHRQVGPGDARVGRREKCRCGGMASCRSASTTLSSPASPEAASAWPMLVLTEPMQQRPPGGAPLAHDRAQRLDLDRDRRARCRCRAPRRSRRRPARARALASASRSTACCAGPLGTVRPLLRPSWLTAEPRITARIGSPAASASERRFSTTTAQPSARTKPSAAASKVLHAPSGAIIPHLEKSTIGVGRQHDVDAARQREVALAGAQALAGQVHRDQRRRAGGVDRHAGPLQAEGEGEAPGGGVERAAGGRVDVGVLAASPARSMLAVVAGGDADEHAGGAARPGGRRRCPRSPAPPGAVSSSRRCCGSIVAASRGEMPKNCGSKRSTWCEEAAAPRDHLARRLRGRGRSRRRRPSGRAAPRRPRRRRRAAARHSASGSSTPPG